MAKKDFRVVIYKNGYPSDKVEFNTQPEADQYRDMMVARRKEERSRGLWQGISWHYISEMNH